MIYAAHFAGVITACWLTAQVLGRARWPRQRPRTAIVCWQAIGLALGLSAIGLPLALALESYRTGTAVALVRFGADLVAGRPPATVGLAETVLLATGLAVAGTLLWTTAGCLLRAVRARRRHRYLLTLVARNDPAVPGALVLDHPSAAAYCLPGVRPRVVVSAGALDLLDPGQLAAVLSHERAHAHQRHDLVLLPFTALCRALPGVPWVRQAHETVALLVEMAADDSARRRHAAGELVGALLRFAAVPGPVTPPGALAVTGARGRPDQPSEAAGELAARVERLVAPARRPVRLEPASALVISQVLVAVPIALFLV
jgi:Zn-dependent protease with chaperone function